MVENISKYVYEVYRLKSVSLAAQKLYISQPALSAAIKKAEKELGAPIFNRKTLPFSLTPEGKVYIEAIERMLQLEAETADRIRDIREVRSGTLKIGTSTHLSFYVIPKILEIFHRKYPQIDINIIMKDSDQLYSLFEKELADIIFTPTESVPEGYTALTLFEEKFVVAVSYSTPGCEQLAPHALTYDELIGGGYSKEKEITDLSLFHGIEFIYNPPNTSIHKKRKFLFGSSGIATHVVSNSSRQQLNYNLMLAGFGALLTTNANIATMPPNTNCRYFVLSRQTARQDFSIVFPAGHSSRITDEFLETARDLFSTAKPLKQLIIE